MVPIVGAVDFKAGGKFAVITLDSTFYFVLPDNVEVPGRVPDIQDEIADFSVVEFEGSGIHGFLHLFGAKIHQHLVTYVPRVHEKFPPFVLPA